MLLKVFSQSRGTQGCGDGMLMSFIGFFMAEQCICRAPWLLRKNGYSSEKIEEGSHCHRADTPVQQAGPNQPANQSLCPSR